MKLFKIDMLFKFLKMLQGILFAYEFKSSSSMELVRQISIYKIHLRKQRKMQVIINSLEKNLIRLNK